MISDSFDLAGSGEKKKGKGEKGSKRKKEEQEEEESNVEPVRLLELPAVMPPPPCLFVEATLAPAESGSQYAFEGWSLNQLDGLASDFGTSFSSRFFLF